MNTREAIKSAIAQANMISQSYLKDLTEEELLVRPVEGGNHIAWQLGHLINSEHGMISSVSPGSMPSLPEGFSEKYTKEAAEMDDASAFHSKAEYMNLQEEQRSGTLNALEKFSDEDLSRPAPESLQAICKTVGEVFLMQATHWMMHAGQWAVIRRKLGREPLF